MAVTGAGQSLEVETPLLFPEDPQRTIADAGHDDKPVFAGTAVGMNPRLVPVRHGFDLDVW